MLSLDQKYELGKALGWVGVALTLGALIFAGIMAHRSAPITWKGWLLTCGLAAGVLTFSAIAIYIMVTVPAPIRPY